MSNETVLTNDTIVTNVLDAYDLMFKQFADPRVKDWMGFGHPFGIIAVISSYLYLVCNYFPNYMKDKKPYNIQRIIQAYNLLQVIACGVLVTKIVSSGWSITDTFGPFTYGTTPKEMDILLFCWCNFVLKFIDLFDTVFFILRKKQNQVSKLHLYHHCSTFFFGWLTTQYLGSVVTTFTIVLNSSVHVLMYTYYFLSTLGPSVQQRIQIIKSKLTTIQMVQFWILAIHTITYMRVDSHPIYTIMGYLFIINLFINFSMFLNFYMRSYKKSKAL